MDFFKISVRLEFEGLLITNLETDPFNLFAGVCEAPGAAGCSGSRCETRAEEDARKNNQDSVSAEAVGRLWMLF